MYVHCNLVYLVYDFEETRTVPDFQINQISRVFQELKRKKPETKHHYATTASFYFCIIVFPH